MASVWARNKVRLSAPSVQRLTRSDPNPSIHFEHSRSGAVVPVAIVHGRDHPMHSLVSPEREAQRTFDHTNGGRSPGFLVSIGLGAGYHLGKFVADDALKQLLIIEPDPSVCLAILTNLDLSDLLGDARVSLIVNPDGDEIDDAIAPIYHPLLHGDLGVVALRSFSAANPEAFERAEIAITGTIERLRLDSATQAEFGSQWTRNALFNLPETRMTASIPNQFESAIVVAAGPSLEQELRSLSAARINGPAIVATDTAFPALATSGIEPDIVVSIDTQIHTYHHFLPTVDSGALFVFELAVHPSVTRMVHKRMFVAGSHPLSRYVSTRLAAMRQVDTSGGNVTCAAIEVARLFGAKKVGVVGADFGYSNGKPYARGTYLYRYFESKSERIRPLSSHAAELVFRDSRNRRTVSKDGVTYTPPLMDHYREMTQTLLNRPGVRSIETERRGQNWSSFLAHYVSDLEKLPIVAVSPIDYVRRLDTRQRSLVSTLFPLATRGLAQSSDAQIAISMARDRTIALGKSILQRFD